MKKKTLVKKATAVSLSGSISNLARRTYNVLLAHAFDDLSNLVRFNKPAKEVFKELKIKSRNWEHLKLALHELKTTELGKDTLGIDGSGEWYSDSLIIAPKIKDGVVYWEYSITMRELLRDQTAYIILNLQIHNNFTKHGLALYELALHWLPPKGRVGHSGLLTVADVRVLFGVGNSYPEFGQLNRSVLQNAIKSVNKPENKSGMHVEMETMKENRIVVGVKFTVNRLRAEDKNLVADVPEKKTFNKLAAEKEKNEREHSDKIAEERYSVYLALDMELQDELWDTFENNNRIVFNGTNEVWEGNKLIRIHAILLPHFKGFLKNSSVMNRIIENQTSQEPK